MTASFDRGIEARPLPFYRELCYNVSRSVKDTEGTTLREAMLSYGLTGKLDGVDRSKEKVKAFIELHMEQGTLLEDEGIDLGVVDGIDLPGGGIHPAHL